MLGVQNFLAAGEALHYTPETQESDPHPSKKRGYMEERVYASCLQTIQARSTLRCLGTGLGSVIMMRQVSYISVVMHTEH